MFAPGVVIKPRAISSAGPILRVALPMGLLAGNEPVPAAPTLVSALVRFAYVTCAPYLPAGDPADPKAKLLRAPPLPAGVFALSPKAPNPASMLIVTGFLNVVSK